jgi:hypothetical protein
MRRTRVTAGWPPRGADPTRIRLGCSLLSLKKRNKGSDMVRLAANLHGYIKGKEKELRTHQYAYCLSGLIGYQRETPARREQQQGQVQLSKSNRAIARAQIHLLINRQTTKHTSKHTKKTKSNTGANNQHKHVHAYAYLIHLMSNNTSRSTTFACKSF